MFKKIVCLFLVGSFLSTGTASADAEDSVLHEKMEEVNRSLKLLRRAKDDYAKCVELVQKAQTLMLECFPLQPYMVEKMPEGKDKEIAMAEYKKLMAESYQKLCKLELAYLSEDLDKIDDAMDEVKDTRKAGHEEFMEEE